MNEELQGSMASEAVALLSSPVDGSTDISKDNLRSSRDNLRTSKDNLRGSRDNLEFSSLRGSTDNLLGSIGSKNNHGGSKDNLRCMKSELGSKEGLDPASEDAPGAVEYLFYFIFLYYIFV